MPETIVTTTKQTTVFKSEMVVPVDTTLTIESIVAIVFSLSNFVLTHFTFSNFLTLPDIFKINQCLL